MEEKTGVELNLLFGRQANVAKFMRRLLVRRFESSEYAFRMSLEYMIDSSRQILKWIEEKGKMPVYKKGNLPDVDDSIRPMMMATTLSRRPTRNTRNVGSLKST